MLPRIGDAQPQDRLREEPMPFAFEEDRSRLSSLTSRIVRDPVFRRAVLRAYHKRCSITGLKLINGGGRAEVEAAHIRPVEANGPDIVSNGLALSGTLPRSAPAPAAAFPALLACPALRSAPPAIPRTDRH